MVLLHIFVFSLALWLGLYLINRDARSQRLRFAGFGLVSYALGWSASLLSDYALTPTLTQMIARLTWMIFLLPAIFWTGSTLYFLPEELPFVGYLIKVWYYILLPLTFLAYLIGMSTNLLFDTVTGTPRVGIGSLLLSILVLLPLLIVVFMAWFTHAKQRKNARGLLLVALLFFTLSTTLLLVPQGWLPRIWLLIAVGFDLLLLGLVVAVLDAFEQGEALLRDIVRSFDFSFGTALLFGGQVALVMLLATGVNFAMLVLLSTTIATCMIVQTSSRHVVASLDKIAFANVPQLRKARAELRDVADALPRVNEELTKQPLDEAEFLRLTRRALSCLGDLSKLASSPLAHLPLIHARLAQRGLQDDAIERAIELKAVLTESIVRLKPRNKGDFGTSDEWRYYNALFFPYVVGLKPYSRRTQSFPHDAVAQEALKWFQLMVPERTLHNWQTSATKLVAQDIQGYAKNQISADRVSTKK